MAGSTLSPTAEREFTGNSREREECLIADVFLFLFFLASNSSSATVCAIVPSNRQSLDVGTMRDQPNKWQTRCHRRPTVSLDSAVATFFCGWGFFCNVAFFLTPVSSDVAFRSGLEWCAAG